MKDYSKTKNDIILEISRVNLVPPNQQIYPKMKTVDNWYCTTVLPRIDLELFLF